MGGQGWCFQRSMFLGDHSYIVATLAAYCGPKLFTLSWGCMTHTYHEHRQAGDNGALWRDLCGGIGR